MGRVEVEVDEVGAGAAVLEELLEEWLVEAERGGAADLERLEVALRSRRRFEPGALEDSRELLRQRGPDQITAVRR